MAKKVPVVRDYMTPDPATLEPEDSLMHVLELMRRLGVRHIPVVLAGELVGLVAEGDVKRAEPSTLSDTKDHFDQVMEATPISRIMIHEPLTVTADTPLLKAAETLYSTKYGSLPVVEDGMCVGILTDNDLLHALVDVLREG
ncbi:MAG TPA: CBS domain-containing protein [Vicinamibacteria bacterium]